ncbi:hypothetical protein M427DRAFT_373528 [Gonapodya prolifera JEL478]|uniref:Uncharacterized protein n=1 Tax=Gonapodya prolifera (strain JEL478) TaxID=1344416 RepID=A0A139AUG5_GONPJ|nr:hypothetical protein M427DRAFT_373528 [Gonapodya prolifera JEL478]|eukprot:KXS20358.1 hypothetical protein M427DRAFT_373528 [Gonapodya prolifera JEL478]
MKPRKSTLIDADSLNASEKTANPTARTAAAAKASKRKDKDETPPRKRTKSLEAPVTTNSSNRTKKTKTKDLVEKSPKKSLAATSSKQLRKAKQSRSLNNVLPSDPFDFTLESPPNRPDPFDVTLEPPPNRPDPFDASLEPLLNQRDPFGKDPFDVSLEPVPPHFDPRASAPSSRAYLHSRLAEPSLAIPQESPSTFPSSNASTLSASPVKFFSTHFTQPSLIMGGHTQSKTSLREPRLMRQPVDLVTPIPRHEKLPISLAHVKEEIAIGNEYSSQTPLLFRTSDDADAFLSTVLPSPSIPPNDQPEESGVEEGELIAEESGEKERTDSRTEFLEEPLYERAPRHFFMDTDTLEGERTYERKQRDTISPMPQESYAQRTAYIYNAGLPLDADLDVVRALVSRFLTDGLRTPLVTIASTFVRLRDTADPEHVRGRTVLVVMFESSRDKEAVVTLAYRASETYEFRDFVVREATSIKLGRVRYGSSERYNARSHSSSGYLNERDGFGYELYHRRVSSAFSDLDFSWRDEPAAESMRPDRESMRDKSKFSRNSDILYWRRSLEPDRNGPDHESYADYGRETTRYSQRDVLYPRSPSPRHPYARDGAAHYRSSTLLSRVRDWDDFDRQDDGSVLIKRRIEEDLGGRERVHSEGYDRDDKRGIYHMGKHTAENGREMVSCRR